MHSRTAGVTRAFTLIELLVVIAIIAILAAILFPVFAQAREKARQSACLSNTKQLGLAIYQYMQDYDETLPIGGYGMASGATSRWYRDIYPYVKSVNVFYCPSTPEPQSGGRSFTPPLVNGTALEPGGPFTPGAYGANQNLMDYLQQNAAGAVTGNVRALSDIPDSAGTFLLCEANQGTADLDGNYNSTTWSEPRYVVGATQWQVMPPGWFTSNANPSRYAAATGDARRRPAPRHNGGLNVIYCDGHAKWTKIESFLGVTPSRPAGWPYGDPNNSWDNR